MKRYLGANIFIKLSKSKIHISEGQILFFWPHNKRNFYAITNKPVSKKGPTAPLENIPGNRVSIMFGYN